jgi:hypothetical protein
VQFILPISTFFFVLLSMLSTAFIAAIFHEVTAITILQLDVIHFCDAAVGTTYVCLCLYLCLCLSCAAHIDDCTT